MNATLRHPMHATVNPMSTQPARRRLRRAEARGEEGPWEPAGTERPGTGRWDVGAWVLLGCLWLAGCLTAAAEPPVHQESTDDPLPHAQQDCVRIGIAPGTWGGVNRGDATAAIKAWARIIMQQRGTALEVETTLFESNVTMRAALEGGRVDAVSMLTDQFLTLGPDLRPDTIYLTAKDQSFTETFVLLVHRNSGIVDLDGLKGRRLLVQGNARAGLAPVWLDTLLARRNLDCATNFLSSVSRLDSASKVVLQVFFRQADACLVTSNVFQLASELNPQLRTTLRVVAASPEVVPALFYFRPGHMSRAREVLEPALLSLHEHPAGQQVLTVFQAGQMIKRPVSILDGTRDLVEEHKRLRGQVQERPPAGSTESKP